MPSRWDDIRLAAAALRREPRWTAGVVGVLGLGVAAVTAAGTLARVTSLVPFRVAPVLEPIRAGSGGWGLPWSAEAVFPATLRAGHLAELGGALVLTAALAFAAGCVAAWILISARSRARRRELGVRSAVGATRRRIARQLVAEGMLLAASGVGGGAIAGTAVGRLLLEHPPEGLAVTGSGGPGGLVAAALAAAGTVWLCAGPARRGAAARTDAFGTPGRLLAVERRGAGDLLASATAALGLPLLIASGLVTASSSPESAGGLAPGVEDSVLLKVRLPASASSPRERADRLDAVLREVREVPGVTAGSLSTPDAWSGMGVSDRVLAECRCTRGGMGVPFVSPPVRHAAVSEGFFRSLGLDVLEGRTFEGRGVREGASSGRGPGDGVPPDRRPGADRRAAGAAPAVVVNRAYDRRTLRGAAAVGKAIRVTGRVRDGEWHRVRGVVGDLAAGGLAVDRPVPTVYLPLRSHPPAEADLVVRGPGDPAALAESARDAAVAAAPGGEVVIRGTLAEEAARIAAPLDAVRRLFGPTAALALLVVAAGVSGATGDEMRRRRTELALRRAVGARRSDVAGLVLRWAARVSGRGVAAGLVFAAPMAGALHLLLPGVDVADPWVWGAAALAVVGAGILGAAGPARRTARADPARHLEGS